MVQLTVSILHNGDKFYRYMPCFIRSCCGISAVLSAWASCANVVC